MTQPRHRRARTIDRAALFATGLFVGVALGLPAGGWLVTEVATAPSVAIEMPAPAAPAITEDDPRWDCRTMGNRVCGPTAVLPDGSPAYPGDYSGAGAIMVGSRP